MIRAALAAVLVTAAIAGACGSGDRLSEPVPTVPTVAEQDAGDREAAGGVRSGPADGDGTEPDGQAREPEADTVETDPDDPDHLTPTTIAVPPAGDLASVSIELVEIATLDEPLALTTVAGDSHLWIAERQGRVVRLNPSTGETTEVLDLRGETRAGGERGLLGLAADSDHLYVNYTDLSGRTHVDAYDLAGRGVDQTSRRELLVQEQPFSNHNGGGLAIDAAGLLHIGFGDGGGSGDPLGAGQDPSTWLGSVLRIVPTPDAEAPYAIPADNPYVEGGGLPEIFLTGVRNPWRFSFDRLTGDLWIGDVGQNSYEEVTLLLAANGGGRGANLGWNLREGLHEFSGPEPEDHADPVYEYGRSEGVSVTGGYVYRGTTIPELFGHYVFGDYRTARVWGLAINTGEVVFRDLGAPVPGGNLASFGEGPDGELYVLSLGGPVARIVAS